MNIEFMIGFTFAAVELVKTTIAAFKLFQDETQREAVLRWIAVVIGILVALAFEFDPFHETPTLIGIVVGGAALAIFSDGLNVAFDGGKAVVARLVKPSVDPIPPESPAAG